MMQAIIEGEVISLPLDIFNQPDLLKKVICQSVWDQLDDEEQSTLLALLPSSLSDETKDETLKLLFSGKNLAAFSSSCSNQPSSPIDDVIMKLKSGHFSPETYQIRKCQKRALKARSKYERSRYNHQLLKEVLVSRQCHLSAISFPQLVRLSRQNVPVSQNFDTEIEAKLKRTSEKMYSSILHDVKQEVATSHQYSFQDLASSESDDDDDSASHMPLKSSPGNLHLVSPAHYKEMLVQHKKRRAAKVNTPDLNVNGIKVTEIINRTFGTSKKLTGLLKKRKLEESIKIQRPKKVKQASKNDKQIKNEKEQTNKIKEKRLFITMPSCYFELIRDVMLLTSDKTTSSIQLLVSDWLISAEASRYAWTSNRSNWKELVSSALEFLCSKHDFEDIVGHQFVMVVDGFWQWCRLENPDDESRMLQNLCQRWIEEVVGKLQISSVHESHSFHAQEHRRYMYAHQAFVYNIDGVRHPVPPVKGTTGPAKEGRVAREHNLLNPDRPPQVTLLALTRDAVARLPGGRGPRSLVCALVRDSQYLIPLITDAQINAAVSGALDRLQCETDPCVKYDVSMRSWIYLHGDRSPEELERIHAEQVGAPRKKKDRGVKKRSKQNDSRKKSQPMKAEKEATREAKYKDNDAIGDGGGMMDVTSQDLTSPLVINESFSQKRSKQSGVKKRVKKVKSAIDGVNTSKENPVSTSSSTPVGVKSLHLAQKKGLGSTWGTTDALNEIPVTQMEAGSVGQTVKSPASLLQSGQPSLKLILKPASGDQQKPIAELVRVVDPPPQRSPAVSRQPVLSAETLRRLSEQLSVMSSRPIKVVQQSTSWSEKIPQTSTYNPNSRLINITARPGTKTGPTSSDFSVESQNTTSGVYAIANPLSQVGVNRNAKLVYLTSNSGADVVFGQQNGDMTTDDKQAKLVHLVHKLSANDLSNTATEMNPGKNNRTLNIQLVRTKSQPTLQLSSGGKVQTIQLLQPQTPSSHQSTSQPDPT